MAVDENLHRDQELVKESVERQYLSSFTMGFQFRPGINQTMLHTGNVPFSCFTSETTKKTIKNAMHIFLFDADGSLPVFKSSVQSFFIL